MTAEWAARVALRVGALRTGGLRLGLTEGQVDEVIHRWRHAHQRSPWPMDWSRVESAVVLRASGLEWEPALS